MKQQVNPVLAGLAILVLLVIVALLIWPRLGGAKQVAEQARTEKAAKANK